MLFSEFQENTGCKDNQANHLLYKRLELIYMNDDTVTKADIYEMGKKLMDNSKSEEELAVEAEVRAEIELCKDKINQYRAEINQYKTMLADEQDKWFITTWKNSIKWRREEIKRLKNKIANLKWIIE